MNSVSDLSYAGLMAHKGDFSTLGRKWAEEASEQAGHEFFRLLGAAEGLTPDDVQLIAKLLQRLEFVLSANYNDDAHPEVEYPRNVFRAYRDKVGMPEINAFLGAVERRGLD